MNKKMTLIKSLPFFIMLFCAVNVGFGQTNLAPGDIAITGFNSDSPKGFTFVLLRDIANTTQIRFTDNGWLNAGGFRTGEGTVVWSATSDLSCGTEITITSQSNPFLASIGTITYNGNFNFSTTGDQILAYQGLSSSPTFVYAINFDGAGWSDATTTNTSALPTGLTNTVNAVDVDETDNGNYNCSVTAGTSLILANVSNSSNWNLSNSVITLGSCGFSCSLCSGIPVTYNGGWSATPDLTTPVTIETSYDTSLGSFQACSLTISSTGSLTIADNTFVEVQNDVTVDGQLIIETQGNFVQKSDTATFTDNTINGVVQQKVKMLQSWYSYTYWSSPVIDETIEGALSTTPIDRRFKFEAVNFVDTQTEIGNTNTFTPGPDGIDDDGNDWQHAAGIMTPGVGYAATASEFGPAFPRQEQFDFYGEFNNGEVLVPLINNSGGAYDDWNFIGNPYPGAISADTFFTVNAGLVDVIYLWDQATPPSNTTSGNEGYNFSADDYAMINGTGTTTGARGDTGLPPNRYVPSGQGFFVEALNTGNVTFNNSMRSITADNSQFFKVVNPKGKSSSTNNGIWFNLSSNNGVFSQVMVGYVIGATNDNDGSFYDAPKNTATGAASILYTTIQGSNKVFAIQGKAPSSLNEDEVINLGFNTRITVPTTYTLSVAQLEGDFLSNNKVYLKDNLLNTLHDLSASDYNFTSEVGEFTNRFEIVFNAQALSADTFDLDANTVQIIQVDDTYVTFKASSNLSIKSVAIYDLLGRQLYQLEGSHNEETYNLTNLNHSVFIAKVALSNGALITKKAVIK